MKLSGMLNLAQVRMFKGVVDVYYHRGRPIARAWPRKPQTNPTPAQVAQRQDFAQVSTWATAVSGDQRTGWTQFAESFPGSWVDYAHHTLHPVAREGALASVPTLIQARIVLNFPAGRNHVHVTWDELAYPALPPLNLLLTFVRQDERTVKWHDTVRVKEKGWRTTIMKAPTLTGFWVAAPNYWNAANGYAWYFIPRKELYVQCAFISPAQTDQTAIQSPVRYFDPGT